MYTGQPAPTTHPSSHAARRFDYKKASMDTVESRAEATTEFLQICLLLTHTSPHVSLYHPLNRCPVDPSFNLFPREPCPHARRKILSNLDPSKPKALHHTARNYLASVLSIPGLGGLDFNMVYCGSFFSQQFFTSLINVDNWVVSPQARPIPSHDTTAVPAMHIYDFLAGVQSIPLGPSALPSAGLSLTQARHVGNLIFHSFAALDIKANFIDCPFASSLLGSRLDQWLRLLDLPQVQVLWEKYGRTTSYQWILLSWSLLFIFQKWISTVKWLKSCGFATVQDTHTQHF
jgi:hypothetical protein